MFGCCVAGRAVETNLQQIDETHALFELPSANTINHVCVFMLGTVSFPPGFGCTVHFFYPGKGFQLLGGLSNEKPSAIFRLRGSFTPSSATSAAHNAFSSISSQPRALDSVTAVLGLSVEPLTDVEAQVSALPPTLAKPGLDMQKDPVLLAERIVKDLINYLSGFVEGGSVTPETTVPMNTVTRWFDKFKSKLQARGISFLEVQD